jgi:hypothetical protein
MNDRDKVVRSWVWVVGSIAFVAATTAVLVAGARTCDTFGVWLLAPPAVAAGTVRASGRSWQTSTLALIAACVLMFVAAMAVFGLYCSN